MSESMQAYNAIPDPAQLLAAHWPGQWVLVEASGSAPWESDFNPEEWHESTTRESECLILRLELAQCRSVHHGLLCGGFTSFQVIGWRTQDKEHVWAVEVELVGRERVAEVTLLNGVPGNAPTDFVIAGGLQRPNTVQLYCAKDDTPITIGAAITQAQRSLSAWLSPLKMLHDELPHV